MMMDEEKRKQGQPTKYRPEYDKQAYKLCLLGATDKELGDFFEVTEQTINNWKIDFPTFFGSIKSGKIEADARVAQSLFKRAIGYTANETQLAQLGGQFTDEKVIPKEVAPDTTAAIFWLKNRQPDKWRDKQEVNFNGDLDIKPLTWAITDEKEVNVDNDK